MRDEQIQLIDLPEASPYPLSNVEPLTTYEPGEDHLVEAPEKIIKTQNYHLAYFGRAHICQNWEFAKYPPKISQNGAKTRVLHYDIVPRVYHHKIRIIAEIYFGAGADKEESVAHLTVTDTTGQTTIIKAISPMFEKYAFIDTTHSALSTSIVDPNPYDLDLVDQDLDVGNVVVGLDLYLTGNAANSQSDRVQMNALSVVDADFDDVTEFP